MRRETAPAGSKRNISGFDYFGRNSWRAIILAFGKFPCTPARGNARAEISAGHYLNRKIPRIAGGAFPRDRFCRRRLDFLGFARAFYERAREHLALLSLILSNGTPERLPRVAWRFIFPTSVSSLIYGSIFQKCSVMPYTSSCVAYTALRIRKIRDVLEIDCHYSPFFLHFSKLRL